MYLCKMKKIVVYFLLFIFALQSTKSLWIITSFQINRDYIASNLCINRFDKIPTCKGQCFLNNELSKEQKDNKKNLTTIEKDTIFIAPQFALLTEIVQQILGFSADKVVVQRCLLSIFGQCLMFKHSRSIIDRLYPELIANDSAIQAGAEHITQFSLAALTRLTQQKERLNP